MRVQFEEDFKSYRVVKKTGSTERRHRSDKHTEEPDTHRSDRRKSPRRGKSTERRRRGQPQEESFDAISLDLTEAPIDKKLDMMILGPGGKT